MKGLSAISAALLVAATSAAVAATNSTNTSTTSTGALEASASTSSVSTPANTSPSTSAGTISGSLQQAAPKKWSADFYAESYLGVQDANKGQGNAASAAFVGINYKINDRFKTYIRQNVGASFSNQEGKDSKYTMEDTEIGLGLGKIVSWNDGGIAVTNRFYLPTGEASRNAGQIARLREVIKTSQTLDGSFEVGHILDPRIHFQSRDTFINAEGKEKETAGYKLVQYAYLEAKLNDIFTTTAAMGTEDAWTRRSGIRTAANHYIDLSGTAQLTKEIALTVGLDNSGKVGKDQERRHAFMRSDETSYYMNVFASM